MMMRDPKPAARRLRIGMLIGTVSVTGGGVIEAVRSLSLALSQSTDISVEVFSLRGEGSQVDFGDIPVHLFAARGPAAFGYAPGLVDGLEARDIDLLHVHGLWMYLSIAAQRWARRSGRSYVISPHGMLDPWALRNARWKKRLAALLYENAHLRNAACLHALCEAEKKAIAAAGFTGPIAVLPNGVDFPFVSFERPPWRKMLPPDSKVLLFLGRVTPKKRVLELIRAFVRSSRGGGAWRLVVVGPVDDAYERRLRQEIEAYDCGASVHIVGPAYGEARAAAYAAADAFILPSVSEGLPMAALEAFASGLPALLTAQCNLPEGFAAGAALRISADDEGIAEGLERFFAMGESERLLMSASARRLAIDRFNWDTIALDMARLYRRLAEVQVAERRRSLFGQAGFPA